MKRPREENPLDQLDGVLGKLNLRHTLITLLYVGLVGFGYSIYIVYPAIWAYAYAVLAVLFTVTIFWILFDLHSQIDALRRHEELDRSFKSRHVLCANPLCERCSGYWMGLSFTTMLVLTLSTNIIHFAEVYSINPYLLSIAGALIFIGTTPLLGAINSILRVVIQTFRIQEETTVRQIKFILGFLSGLSISAMVIGVLMTVDFIGFEYNFYVGFPTLPSFVYTALAVLFSAVILWISINLLTPNDSDWRSDRVDAEIESMHLLCSTLCGDCRGYWTVLSYTVMFVVTLYGKVIPLVEVYAIDPYMLSVSGLVILMGTTPFLGVINKILRAVIQTFRIKDETTVWQIKSILGFLPGLSISAMVIGVLMILP